MQNAKKAAFGKRMQYYLAKSYANQLAIGEPYDNLKPIILLTITSFELSKNPNYLSHHLVRERTTGEHLFTDFEFIIVELPKFKKKNNELVSLADQWAYFLKNAKDWEVPPPEAQLPPIAHALHVLEKMRWTKPELDLYLEMGVRIRDELGGQETSFKDGLNQGISIGITQGVTQGIDLGIPEGENRKAYAAAHLMLADGEPVEKIARYTGLTVAQIETIDLIT